MKKTSRLPLLSLLSLLSLASFADVSQVLTYRGVLRRTGGYERTTSLEMTFRLYDSKAPDTALWARTMRVPVDTNGVFYAELADTNGNDPDGIGYTLADAMGAIKGVPEIGLTPPNSERRGACRLPPELHPHETRPRQDARTRRRHDGDHGAGRDFAPPELAGELRGAQLPIHHGFGAVRHDPRLRGRGRRFQRARAGGRQDRRRGSQRADDLRHRVRESVRKCFRQD